MISILHVTDHYRGDHAADVAIAIEPKHGETVQQLCERLALKPTDRIEIRTTEEIRKQEIPF